MSIADNGRFDELVSQYLDASLRKSEEGELLNYLSDEEFAERFHEITRLNTEIAGLLAGSMPNEAMVELVRSDLMQGGTPSSFLEEFPNEVTAPVSRIGRIKSKRNLRILLTLAAMLVGLLVVTTFFAFHNATTVSSGLITSVHGEVYWGRTPLKDDQPLSNGETIRTVGAESRATLTLADGTQIRLMGDTSFKADLKTGKRHLILEQGTLHAIVAKQKESDPLIFASSNALATVRGTELTLIAQPQDTYLVVVKGAVSLQRSSGGPEILIQAGNYGHVESAGEYHSFPFQRLPLAVQDQVLFDK